MFLKQTRINSLSHLASLPPEAKLKICIHDVSRFPDKVNKFGFKQEDDSGSTILPAAFNRYSFRNAEQYATIDKSLPKEKYTQTLYWTRHEWAGRDETREVTDFTDIVRERYHRDYHAPFSVSFSLVTKEQIKSIVSDEIVLSHNNTEKIMNTINMLLGLFGECTIETDNSDPNTHTIRLDWDILPKGNYPWETIKREIEDICRNSRRTQQQMMLRNCDVINEFKPDFRAYGRSGFRGYVIFGFTTKNLYILESILPNNATYVFENQWEELSKLTKAEILNQDLQKARIIHKANWVAEFNKLMKETVE
ncbi:MAG: hypothetical protein LKJ86_06885 [Oscillibacter sp.]|nr:hypothetical protein [Oscillibacter sp.]